MAEAIVSSILGQLTSIFSSEIQQEVRLVVGVEEEVKKLTNNLTAIQAVLVDAEQRQVKETSVRFWVDRLKDASYDMEDVLDEWNTAIMKLQIEGGHENALLPKKKVCFLFPSCFGIKQVLLRHDIACKIREINKNLDDIAKAKDILNFAVIKSTGKKAEERVPTTSLIHEYEISGRRNEEDTLVRKLLSNNGDKQKGLHIISIVGMGGIGKTTLAQLAYNNIEVINNFEKRIWVCVSDPFDEFRIAKAIIETLEGHASNLEELESLLQHIRTSILQKKFLLVLDDVWIEDYNRWEPFCRYLKDGLLGSKLLITTRKETVARMVESDIITIKELSEEACWSLFTRIAFFDRSYEECEKLEEVGRKIVEKCKGLPLAIKSIGSLLRFKKTKEGWQRILDNEMWELEEFEKGILPPLLLSYNELPSMIKQCFLYCAMFPKDYSMGKDQLIKLWMAQGYLGLEEQTELEITGEECFDHLAMRSFFQDFEKDDGNNIIRCKMHDIVHDFAQFLTKKECLSKEVHGDEEPFIDTSHHKVRHSMLTVNGRASLPISIYNVKKLRSLFIFCRGLNDSSCHEGLKGLFDELAFLRALSIGVLPTFIKEIPQEIGKLLHLRYLDLSFQDIEKLPETLCELYHLQSLDVSHCALLQELPQGIGKLINLRHLINESTDVLRYMPIGIERLTRLQTLSQFVAVGNGDGHERKASTLECLKNLNHLKGQLIIVGLGNVANVSEAESMEIKKKKNLLNLFLSFSMGRGRERLNEDDEMLLEVLEPPPNLEKLEIYDYRGKTFSSNWMTLLSNLRELIICDCIYFQHFPPLLNLSSLKSLELQSLSCVKRVCNEFWGLESDGTSSSSVVLFPKLKSLAFTLMNEWEEWNYKITREGEAEEDITFMPCLDYLKISYCNKLKALPDHILQRTTLKKLVINACLVLEERYREGTGEDWPKICHIPEVEIKPSRFNMSGTSRINFTLCYNV